MFAKILIANRGEIACRVIDTARKLGVKTVAVYSDADAKARHVEMADEAVHIGASAVSESYLVIDRIIGAARTTGAEAIHPGYGFLSENPDFVEACEAANLTFIGPSAKAIRAMGLKDAAKALMERAGVPVVPGYHGDEQGEEHLAAEAAKIGYPVLIKAVAGGGGKGMRLVEQPGQFSAALVSAMSEAKSAFGNPAVLIEKYISSPRHIEVQVFGDGNSAVHLYERDCSLQRRHQKVIEEAPAPGMTDEMRGAMGAAAVRAAEAIGYKGAGTIEFIVDGSDGLHPDRFWFMEMNTRLQVEHPVTEAITGVDLVEWQLRVASGEALPMAQGDIPLNGHAFEARLYAEDANAGFLPATGRLEHLAFAADARIDTGVRPGDTISPFYDPMIAKVTVHGATRAIALQRLGAALGDTRIAGTVTNIGFLRALAAHKGFGQGEVDTGLIARDFDALTAVPAVDSEILALCALAVYGEENARTPLAGFSIWPGAGQTVSFDLAGEAHSVRLHVEKPGQVVSESGVRLVFSGGSWQGPARRATLWQGAGRAAVFDGANDWHVVVPDPLLRGGADTGNEDGIMAPMPGLVTRMSVAVGDRVSKGDPLAVLEAMKMEHSLTAPRDGVVAELRARAGDQVEAGQTLLLLEIEE